MWAMPSSARLAARVVQLAQHDAARAGSVARQRQLAGRALDEAAPEGAAFGRVGQISALACWRKVRGELGQRADPFGQRRLDPAAQHRRQGGRRAAGRDGDDHVAAIDDRRQDEIAERGTVGHVHRNARRLGERMGRAIALFRAGGDERRDGTVEVRRSAVATSHATTAAPAERTVAALRSAAGPLPTTTTLRPATSKNSGRCFTARAPAAPR